MFEGVIHTSGFDRFVTETGQVQSVWTTNETVPRSKLDHIYREVFVQHAIVS